ncbi:MAG: MOSC domain-containing protein [Solirubrobacteraceae bacterium]
MSTRAECVSEIVGAEGAPAADAELTDWLAARGLGLAAVADPAAFSWPGPFLAREGDRWAVLFGVPPGVLFGGPMGAIEEAWVVAPFEVSAPAETTATSGRVEALAVAPEATAPMQARDAVTAVAGRGLEGDRYAQSAGTFSPGGGTGREITLVAAEALEDAGVAPLDARRNVIVRGVDLDALRGRRFRIGEVECVGRRRCEPCAHLQRLTRPGVLRALVHRGGLRADILTGGELRIGDQVTAL